MTAVPWSAPPEEVARALVEFGEGAVRISIPIEGGVDGQSLHVDAGPDEEAGLHAHVVRMLTRIITSVRAKLPADGPCMAVKEAAEKLGVTQSAIRQAIYSGRLSARKERGAYVVQVSSVAQYRVSNRGPKSRWKEKS